MNFLKKIALYKCPGEKLDIKKDELLLVGFLLWRFISYQSHQKLMKSANFEYLSFRKQNGQPFGSQFGRQDSLLVLLNQLCLRETTKNG